MVSRLQQEKPTHTPSSPPRWLVVTALIALAANLRAAVNVLGPVLPDIRSDLALSGLTSGVLTALPPFAFAAFGIAGPVLARRLGAPRTVVLGLVVLTGGQLLRALWPTVPGLLLGSLFSLAAIAVANVLIPAFIARRLPTLAAAMTSAYTVTMAAFATLASSVTLPLEHALGAGWQTGLGMWAVLSVLALVPWLVLAASDRATPPAASSPVSLRDVAHSRRAWALMLVFALQSFQAYVTLSWYPTVLRDAGLSLEAASGYTGLVALGSLFGSLVIPFVLNRIQRQTLLIIGLSACYVIGYVGTIAWPLAAPAVWTLFLGLGATFFPMTLYLIGQRARTHTGVLALSGFVQSGGYVVAGTGLVAFGALQGHSTNWTPALLVMIATVAVLCVAGLVSEGHWYVENELPTHPV